MNRPSRHRYERGETVYWFDHLYNRPTLAGIIVRLSRRGYIVRWESGLITKAYHEDLTACPF